MTQTRVMGRCVRMFCLPAVLLSLLSLGGCVYVHDHDHHGYRGYRGWGHHHHYDYDDRGRW